MHTRRSGTKPPGRRPLTAAIYTAKNGLQRSRTTLGNKVSILDFIEANPNLSQDAVAKHFQKNGFPKINQSTISRIEKNKEKIREEAKNAANLAYKCSRFVKFPEVDAELASWVLQKRTKGRGQGIDDETLRKKARYFAKKHKIDGKDFLRLSNGWVDSFRKRYGLRSHAEASSITEKDAKKPRRQLRKTNNGVFFPSSHSAGSSELESAGETSMAGTPENEVPQELALPRASVSKPLSQSSRSSSLLSDSMTLPDDIGPAITQISPDPVKINGHFCDVFEGVHEKAGKVALKRPRIDSRGYDATILRRFEREAATWRELSHPHVLEFLGTFNRGGHIYLVSPFIDKGTLAENIAAHPNVNRIRWLCETADAVRYLHEKDVVHGDLKASNILIDGDGLSRLCDFGLSKLASSRTSTAMRGAGTFRWQSPELWNNVSKSFESDVYAFGMTITEVSP
ncbi:hypothetical protein FS837_012098 [Tulasnella sp. UAMH 9824]|nr:hypothetical protein FS837_012098 [Tulasnella sp. UAMH 9824]